MQLHTNPTMEKEETRWWPWLTWGGFIQKKKKPLLSPIISLEFKNDNQNSSNEIIKGGEVHNIAKTHSNLTMNDKKLT